MKISDKSRLPLVSVLMPAYNQADFVADALDSLLAQTYTNWEVAVVDDGSPDNVAEIVKTYCDKDSRIKFYHTENHGVSEARNFAASKSSGQYLLPLDADDTFSPTYMEKCVQAFESDPTLSLVYCDWRMFGATDWSPPVCYKGYKDLLSGNTIFCSAMIRKSDFDKTEGYDTKIPFGFEDWELWIRLLNDDSKVYQIPEKLFNYRIKEHSRSTDLNKEENERITREYIYNKHKDKYDTRYPDFIKLLHQIKTFEDRENRWKNKSMLSRIKRAIKGTL